MIFAHRSSNGEGYESHLRKVEGFESQEIADNQERMIRKRYTGLSIEERNMMLDTIASLKLELGRDINPYVYNALSDELDKYEGIYNYKYTKAIVTYNKEWNEDSSEPYCHTEFVELTDEDINNPSKIIEQAIEDALKIQKWQEDMHDRIVDMNLG